MTTPEQPRTAAGRALLAKADSEQDWRGVPVLADILAIEAQARPAVASELRAALEAKRGEQDSLGRFFHEPNGTVLLWSDVDAALASDAGPEPLKLAVTLLDCKWRDDYAITSKVNHLHRDGTRVAHDVTEWCPDLRLGTLASDAGSVGALDVERLARAFIESVAATSNDPHLSQEAERILYRIFPRPKGSRPAPAPPPPVPHGPTPEIDEERLVRALLSVDPEEERPAELAAAIAAAYDAERQGES